MSETQYDNEGKGRIWRQENVNPKAPVYAGELTVNGKLWRLVIWPESTPRAGGKNYHRIQLEEPKEKGQTYHNSPAPQAPTNNAPVNTPKEYPPMKSALEVEEQERLARMDDIPF